MDVIADADGHVTIAGRASEIIHVEMSGDGNALVVLAGDAARELDGKLPHVIEHLPGAGDGDNAPKAWIEARIVTGGGHDGQGEAIGYIGGMQRSMIQAAEAIAAAQKWIADASDDSGSADAVQNGLDHAVQVLTDSRSCGDLVVAAIRDGTACEQP